MPWPGMMITTCMSCLATAGADKETNQENLGGAKRGRRHQSIIYPTNLPESFSTKSILAERGTCHQEGPWVRPNMGQAKWLARDNPETNPITIKPETSSNVAEQFSWVPFLCCSPPRHPFSIKPFALSARVSPWTIHFSVLDKSPRLDTGRGPLPETKLVLERVGQWEPLCPSLQLSQYVSL